MTGDEILNAMEHIDPDLIEAAEVPPKKKHAKPYWFVAVAAVLALAIGLGALLGEGNIPGVTTGPALLDSRPSSLPDGPHNSPPSSICFESVEEIQELFSAAMKGQTALTHFLEANISYYGTDFSTQADILEFRAYLSSLLLPCRDAYENDFFSLYYYPGYGIDIFCDVDGIRYCFVVRSYAAWSPDGDEATTVTLDGVSAELREGSYGSSRRLFATFYVGQQVVSMWAQTTNPAEVNLSGFYWGTLLPEDTPTVVPLANLLSEPTHPYMNYYPNYNDYSDPEAYDYVYEAWKRSQKQQYDQPEGYADGLTDFFHTSIAQFLQDGNNPTYSPVNVYLAMAMLAETAGGNSRQQILDLFGLDAIEQLRQQASYVWNAHYCDDGLTNLLLANSLWLDDSYAFKQETAQLLAEHYYASSFSGNLGTKEMDQQLRSWLNLNTGGLLQEQAENVALDPATVFALASTVYFTASWNEKFSESQTADALFHGPESDMTVPFMHKTMQTHLYYWGEHFGAICLELTGENSMWLILPDEGYTVADILESEDYLQMTLDPGAWENKKVYKINLSLPKFDVASQMDLCDGMKAMGITDIFDYTVSDFTSITDTPMLYVDQINHAARVLIDEDGVKGAAFTVIDAPGAGMPEDREEIEFNLDRPFLFIVSSRDNLPLFAGVVNEP